MTAPLLQVQNLQVAFNGQPVVHGIDFSIAAGEKLALVGESGSGKSVTAHSILQLLPETGTKSSGSIRYRGQQLLAAHFGGVERRDLHGDHRRPAPTQRLDDPVPVRIEHQPDKPEHAGHQHQWITRRHGQTSLWSVNGCKACKTPAKHPPR